MDHLIDVESDVFLEYNQDGVEKQVFLLSKKHDQCEIETVSMVNDNKHETKRLDVERINRID